MVVVYIGLGSNIGNRDKNLERAIDFLNLLAGKLITMSGLYESEPWGFKSEHKFLNQVIKIETSLDPFILLDKISQIERDMGRKKNTARYTDRIIDIDILFYDKLKVNQDNLQIPHPRILQRKFTAASVCC